MCGHVFRQTERRYSAEAMPVGGDVPAKEITVCRGCFLELADSDEQARDLEALEELSAETLRAHYDAQMDDGGEDG